MRNRAPFAAALVVLLWLPSTGVADDQFKYYWSTYEYDLFYANTSPDDPEKAERLEATLLKIIKQSDTSGRKPPPGILAEYGFFLYERGQTDEAIEYFEREAGQWPESRVFMERVIVSLRTGEAE
ncbi:MAG: DUF4810 domain-containing protein [Gammaproteobacteria bacterium]|nr:DUF4810 domain-containing protein [Gammaproteobacteria bacterium]MDH4256372.1 DUF4810 domain-containing protein [Gammaproteobacteria bacterium]MDH5501606.1 DUF4810 domain-containing protein [Gammaproteobacteria bacterium]